MKKEDKKYEINTIDMVIQVVNEDNIDNFLVDFGNFLRMALMNKNLGKMAYAFGAIKELPPPAKFTWIDDGKNDATINVNLKDERK